MGRGGGEVCVCATYSTDAGSTCRLAGRQTCIVTTGGGAGKASGRADKQQTCRHASKQANRPACRQTGTRTAQVLGLVLFEPGMQAGSQPGHRGVRCHEPTPTGPAPCPPLPLTPVVLSVAATVRDTVLLRVLDTMLLQAHGHEAFWGLGVGGWSVGESPWRTQQAVGGCRCKQTGPQARDSIGFVVRTS